MWGILGDKRSYIFVYYTTQNICSLLHMRYNFKVVISQLVTSKSKTTCSFLQKFYS